MDTGPFRFQPERCRLLGREVWAVLLQQPDGTWQIVNCLDKARSCFSRPCAFTSAEGTWPYDGGGGPSGERPAA